MILSENAQQVYRQIGRETKLGDLRKIAHAIKKDHTLATELWQTGEFLPRLLAILVMDKKALTADVVDRLFADMQAHGPEQRNQLADWLMANQLAKDRKTTAMMATWEHSDLVLQRRIFWYYQARLRWTGQVPPDNTQKLLDAIEQKIAGEAPEVQWAMNFTAAWIGVFEPQYRNRCIQLGETTGLYKDEVVHKGCTPNYLPAFISIEAGKRKC